MPLSPPSQDAALAGATLAGRYHLESFVGEGSLGAVFEATNTEGQRVAVKVIRRAVVSDDALSRFIRVASVIAGAESPHLVPILDVGHDLARDLVFVVMPLFRDANLASVLRRTGPLAPLTAARLALAAADALSAAHALDVVHRNVKPSNLFLVAAAVGGAGADAEADGGLRVRLADVGLAARSRVGEDGEPSARVSWQYVSPEQATRGRAVDLRADVFSLGATLFELLSGAPPWSGSSSRAELLERMSSQDAPALQDVAPWVDASIASIVDRALRREPAQRFASAEAMASRLRALLGGDERVTSSMLVPIEPAEKTFTARRLSIDPASPFAPTLDIAAAGESPPDPLIGHRLGGRYVVRKLIGRGGMGAVYEVEAAGGARFAAKVILRDVADENVALVARFLREGRAVTRIEDPHVTRTIELGTDITLGVPFIVMERLVGRDLGALFLERGAIEPLPLLRVFLQVARGLAAAHREGIVHRDIKPANVFLHAPDEARPLVAKVCDFGLAKASAAREGEASYELTRSGGMLGTPHYMSPEHATSAKSVDARTDVWSLSASLYEGLSGRKLWGTITSLGELMAAICTRAAPSLESAAPWVDPDIARLVDKGLARDPEGRWSSMAELAAAIAKLVGEHVEVRVLDLVSVDAGRRAARLPVSPRAETWAARSASAPSDPEPPAAGTYAGHASVAAGSTPSTAGHPSRDGGVVRQGHAARRFAAGGALVVALLLAFVAVRRAATPRRAIAVAPDAARSPPPPGFGSSMSESAEATAAYRAGIQAFRDGAGTTAREKLEAATLVDPTFAAAHLRRLVLSLTADEAARAHATAAAQLRVSLSEHDRALLDAYLPWSSVPQEAAETERKLSELVEAQPDDPDYAYFSCRIRVFLGHYARATEACDRAARLDPELVDALHYRALNLAYLDDVPGATRAYEACLKASRMATSCLSELALLQSAEGKCADAVATARRWIAIEPTSPWPQRALAYALLGAGEPTEAVRDALERTWALLPESDREVERPRMLGAMDILAGDFAGADARFREWETRVAKSRDEFEHMLVTTWRLPLLFEMGKKDEAARLAADYMRRRSAWTPTPNADYSILIRAALFSLGLVTREAFANEREAWLLAAGARERVAGQAPAFDWSLAYTHSILDRRDAQEAFDALPRFLPLPDATARTPDFDEPAANVFVQSGRPTEALAFARRAARSCTVLDSPIEVTRAYLRIGQASEALYDLPGACAAYHEVLARWGKSPSITAKEARAAHTRLGCAAR